MEQSAHLPKLHHSGNRDLAPVDPPQRLKDLFAKQYLCACNPPGAMKPVAVTKGPNAGSLQYCCNRMYMYAQQADGSYAPMANCGRWRDPARDAVTDVEGSGSRADMPPSMSAQLHVGHARSIDDVRGSAAGIVIGEPMLIGRNNVEVTATSSSSSSSSADVAGGNQQQPQYVINVTPRGRSCSCAAQTQRNYVDCKHIVRAWDVFDLGRNDKSNQQVFEDLKAAALDLARATAAASDVQIGEPEISGHSVLLRVDAIAEDAPDHCHIPFTPNEERCTCAASASNERGNLACPHIVHALDLHGLNADHSYQQVYDHMRRVAEHNASNIRIGQYFLAMT